ncbi:helix-turn-helix domain-containing protein [Aerococcus christensenii]|uniref:DNA-binding helix-turn-helix protein n=1 Tax=Aerococcus christensenii TaxID=87541 RepID=A0A133XSR7_9LACT|nr:helix-turn-helix transcriptional regulator [Aerococcus christensenii]KXB33977.1 DNA-binding helix-turn-helix protein [Aerococcus christensenii]MDK8234710.1 helix-turn-helix transcriptional regulator [Aerococcus christensenii]DAK63170.1 MAG TPA: helix-turn-helix domain protein [Caudoviricetes sp.]
MEPGQLVRKYRLERGLSLKELAERVHRTDSTICRMESGERTISIQTMAEFARVLGFDPKEVFD